MFEDFLKLADYGVVDMTREAISRALNIPLDILNKHIDHLESPDPKSRNTKNEGRRIARLDKHRDWGWAVVNWDYYSKIKTRADVAERVKRHRESKKFKKPSLENVRDQCLKVGLPASVAEDFINYYESNGWRVGQNPMRSWTHSLGTWKKNHENRTYDNRTKTNQRPNPRLDGVSQNNAVNDYAALAGQKQEVQRRQYELERKMAETGNQAPPTTKEDGGGDFPLLS